MADNRFVKKVGVQDEFTDEMVAELERCYEDPVHFIKTYVKVQHPVKGAIPFELYDYQEEAVRMFQANRFNISMWGRQQGKTATVAAYILWFVCFNDDKTALIASKGAAHATEIVDRIKFMYEELPMWLKPGVKVYNRQSIEFSNGSEIISQATTENTGRGYSISLLYVDELGFVRPNIQQAMWTSIQPTLATGGACIITSTPNGDSDLFAEIWRGAVSGINNFAYLFAPWYRHPERDQAWATMMEKQLGAVMFAQECNCEFVSSDPLLISSITLSNLKTAKHLREAGLFKWWIDAVNVNQSYLVGVDVGGGTGSDFSVIQVIEFPSLQQVAEFRSNNVSIPQLYGRIKWVLNALSRKDARGRAAEVYWSFENNGIGHAIGALYQNDENPPEAELITTQTPGKQNQYGVVTTGKNKILLCLELKKMIERISQHITINSEATLFELKNYVATGGSYAAKPGATDDSVAALLVVIQVFKRFADYNEAAYEMVHNYHELNNGLLDEDGNEIDDSPLPFVM